MDGRADCRSSRGISNHGASTASKSGSSARQRVETKQDVRLAFSSHGQIGLSCACLQVAGQAQQTITTATTSLRKSQTVQHGGTAEQSGRTKKPKPKFLQMVVHKKRLGLEQVKNTLLQNFTPWIHRQYVIIVLP
jgi:hypothetical protein